jgi:hypothetical protein
MNYARFNFFNPVRFFADIDDSFDPYVSSAQQPEGLLAAGFSLCIRTFSAEMELLLAQNFAVSLYACYASSAVEALCRDLILCSRVLVDPRQINPAVRIEYVRRNQVKLLGVNVRRISELFHMARQQKVERLYPVLILLSTIELCQ